MSDGATSQLEKHSGGLRRNDRRNPPARQCFPCCRLGASRCRRSTAGNPRRDRPGSRFARSLVDRAGGTGVDRAAAARGRERLLPAPRRPAPATAPSGLRDATPLEAGERESIGRRPRRQKTIRPATTSDRPTGTAYSDLGRAVADKLVDLGREAAELRAELRTLREEARDARAARDEAEQRARSLGERSRELESRAEMAESNLRALLATARSGGNTPKPHDAPVGDAEMAAILGVLRGDEDEDGDGEERRGDDGSETSDAAPAAANQPPTAAG